MNRILSFVIFILVAISIYFFMHHFVFKTIVKFIPIQPRMRSLIKIFFWVSGLSFILSMALSRMLNFHLLNHYAFSWLGILSISFGVLIWVRLINLVFPKYGQTITSLSLLLIVLLSGYGLFNGLRMPVVKTLKLKLERLSPEMSGFRIVQLSDLHLNEGKSAGMLARMVERVNGLKPDLIVITGDFIDGGLSDDCSCFHSLKKLRASRGVLIITGNHEFYEGIRQFLDISRKLNFTVLRNELLVIDNHLQVIGIDDNEARRFSMPGPDLDTPIRSCDPGKPIVVLRHRPEGFDEAVERGVGLQISGHTHDGQIPPMTWLVRLFLKYPYGLYGKNGAHIYTSCGTGYWGPPMRICSRAEIVEFVLLPENPGAGSTDPTG